MSIPDIHVSFFDPENMSRALAADAGLSPAARWPGFIRGCDDDHTVQNIEILGPQVAGHFGTGSFRWPIVVTTDRRIVRISDDPIGHAR